MVYNILIYIIPIAVFFWGVWMFVKWLYRTCSTGRA